MTGTYKALCSIVFVLFLCVAVIGTLLLILCLADIIAHGGQYPWWAWPVMLVVIGASLALGYVARSVRHRLSHPAG